MSFNFGAKAKKVKLYVAIFSVEVKVYCVNYWQLKLYCNALNTKNLNFMSFEFGT